MEIKIQKKKKKNGYNNANFDSRLEEFILFLFLSRVFFGSVILWVTLFYLLLPALGTAKG